LPKVDVERAHALGLLAPHLSPQQIIDAFAAATAIGSEGDRAQALGSLAPHLSPGQIADAFAAAKRIRDDEYRAEALRSLAPYVSPTQYATLLNKSLQCFLVTKR
jgi:hypothetical protein